MLEKKETILIVDDNEFNIEVLLDLLHMYDLVVATDAKSAFEVLKNEDVDLILLDIMMPEIDGYEACRIIKSNDETKDIPIIFATAKVDEESIQKAYESGGVDYVIKPFKALELLARVRTHLKLSSVIKNLKYISSYDEMTGIYNRRKFFELASKSFVENKGTLFAIMIDIDNFKFINDKYGHHTGDKVIKKVAKIISSEIDESFIFGRVGGEEFAIVCNKLSNDEILESMEKVRTLVESSTLYSDYGDKIKVTISKGIASASKDTISLDSLLKQADVALYEAKNTGRNRVVFR